MGVCVLYGMTSISPLHIFYPRIVRQHKSVCVTTHMFVCECMDHCVLSITEKSFASSTNNNKLI